MKPTRREFLQAAGLVAMAGPAWANTTLSGKRPAGATGSRFKVTWLGGATMVIAFGDLTILTDPTFGETFAMGDPNDAADHETVRTHRRLTPLGRLDLDGVDLVLLSHAHEDHFDARAAADLDHTVPIVLPSADKETVERKGFMKVDGTRWGDTRRLETSAGRVSITVVPARHSRDRAIAMALGTGNGYWMEFGEGPGRRTMYWTGDTMPTEDVVTAVKSLGEPDLLVPHVGGVGRTGPFGQISMGAADVVALAAEIRPKYVLPIHHSTYAFYREPIGELAARSEGAAYRLDLVPAGSTVVYG